VVINIRAKASIFPHSGGVQCGHFSDKGERGQFFAILWGRLLWTAPNYYLRKHCDVIV